MSAQPTCHDSDVVVIGAGPAGLWAAFELSLLSCQTQIVDALPTVGGQVVQLYGDKIIYDIPGVAQCDGRTLAQTLLQQLEPWAVPIHLKHTISSLQRDGAHLVLRSGDGTQWRCRALIIAAGVGAFAARKLKGVDLSALEGHSVHYHDNDARAGRCVVYGGEQAALATAVTLAEQGAQSVALVYRRDVLQADAPTRKAFAQLQAQGRIRVSTAMITGFVAHGAQLHALKLSHPDGSSSHLSAEHLWIKEGLSPQLGAIAQWGLAMERKQLCVDPCTLATSAADIYAIGDVVHYPNKRKLIVGAFHEATQAAYAIAQTLHPAGLPPQEYTSSSARLQKKLRTL